MASLRPLLFALALALLTAAAVSARYVKQLDVDVDTPVYRVPDGVPLHDESLRYVLRWAGVPVAGASVAFEPASAGDGLDFDVSGATHPALDWLFPYRFWGAGHLHTSPLRPDRFVVDECTWQEHDRTEIRFPADASPIRGLRHRRGRWKQYEFHSDNTYDIPSAAYLLMNVDYAPGAVFELDTFTGKSRYLLRATVAGRERVRAASADHDAWRLRLETRELTDDDPDGRHRETDVWVSPDRPRRLLYASSKTFVGAITLELVGEGAATPLGAPPEAVGAPCL